MSSFFNSSLGIACILIAVIAVIYFLKPKPKYIEDEEDSVKENQVAISKVSSVIEEKSKETNDLEVAAAIMGALSAYLNVPVSKLKIKSIKRLEENKSAWGRKGLEEI